MQSLSELKWCATRALVCTALLSATALAETATNAVPAPTTTTAPPTPAVTSKPPGDTPPPPPGGGPGGGGPGGGGGGGRRLMRYDKNGDGVIDAAEKAEMPEAFRKMYDEMMTKYDTNKDGKLDDTERAAMRAAGGFGRGGDRPPGDGAPPAGAPGEGGMRRGGFNRPAGELGIMKKFDKNDDGKIDADERAAMPPQVMALWDEWIVQHPQGTGGGPGGRQGGPGRGPLEMIKRFDTNNDGVIDEKEKAAMPEEARTRYEEFMVRFDTNKNGKIDEEERAVIVQTFGQRPPGPPPEGGGDAGAPPPPPVPQKSDADKAKIQAAVLKKWDKNGNGKLDDDEKQQMKTDSLPKYDKNGDGQLNAEERAAMEKDLLDGK